MNGVQERKKSQLFNGDHDGGGLDDMIKNTIGDGGSTAL